MRFSTHLAGAAIAAMVAMTAIPTDAEAVILGTFGFESVDPVTFNFDTESDIVAGIVHKEYEAAIVNIAGDLIFAGIIDVGDPVDVSCFRRPDRAERSQSPGSFRHYGRGLHI